MIISKITSRIIKYYGLLTEEEFLRIRNLLGEQNIKYEVLEIYEFTGKKLNIKNGSWVYILDLLINSASKGKIEVATIQEWIPCD